MTAAAMVGCKPAPPSAAYLAACEGKPLGTVERRQQALEDGYEIDRQFDCITKSSAKILADEKAQWEAANTPDAKEARQLEFEQRAAEARRQRELRERAASEAAAERERDLAAAEQIPIESVDVNSATLAQLADLPGLGLEAAQQIVAARASRSFRDWNDVVRRVAGLAAAETAVRASAFGLTVNGRSLDGAEPGSALAAQLRHQWRRRGA